MAMYHQYQQQSPPYNPNNHNYLHPSGGSFPAPFYNHPQEYRHDQTQSHFPPSFHQHQPSQPTGGVPYTREVTTHRRGAPPADELTMRLKEEQRRKQIQYSQALAEQVQQHQQKKQMEREAKRRENAADLALMNLPVNDPSTNERGFLDGFGQQNAQRTNNFARGQRRVVPQAQASFDPPIPQSHPTHQAFPPSDVRSHLPMIPPQYGAGSYNVGGINPTDPPSQPQTHGEYHEYYEPPPPYLHPSNIDSNGINSPTRRRRQRTDITGTVGVGAVEAANRLQQQLDLQETLRRQIEEKNRLKAEEKRRREDEERREIARMEAEKVRVIAEEARLKEEKRRRAQLAEEEAKLVAQQHASATQAAAQASERTSHLNLQYRQLKGSSPQRSSPDPPSPQPQPIKTLQRDPFTNSRAHLFEDLSPSVPLNPHTHSPSSYSHHLPQQQMYQDSRPVSFHGDSPGIQNAPHLYGEMEPIDPIILKRQYEAIKEELEHQRQLVEQLRVAHAQLQQSPNAVHTQRVTEVPTRSELEQLRLELHEELNHREELHRQEIEALRRQTKQGWGSPEQLSPVAQHIQQPNQPDYSIQPPTRRLRPRISPFVQEALLDEDEEVERRETYHVIDHEPELTGQSTSQQLATPSRALLPTAKSLQCKSELVYFDGHIEQMAGRRKPSLIPMVSEEYEKELPHSVIKLPSPIRQNNSIPNTPVGLDENEKELPHSVIRLPSPIRQTKIIPMVVREDELNFSSPIRENNQVTPNEVRPSNQEETIDIYSFQESKKTVFCQTETVECLDPPLSRNKYPSIQRIPVVPKSAICQLSTSHHPLMVSSWEDDEDDFRVQPSPSQILSRFSIDMDDNEEGGEEEESLNGDELEAIFMRNIRRHEILTGFLNASPSCDTSENCSKQLNMISQQVEQIKHSSVKNTTPLAGSSRWLPTSL